MVLSISERTFLIRKERNTSFFKKKLHWRIGVRMLHMQVVLLANIVLTETLAHNDGTCDLVCDSIHINVVQMWIYYHVCWYGLICDCTKRYIHVIHVRLSWDRERSLIAHRMTMFYNTVLLRGIQILSSIQMLTLWAEIKQCIRNQSLFAYTKPWRKYFFFSNNCILFQIHDMYIDIL